MNVNGPALLSEFFLSLFLFVICASFANVFCRMTSFFRMILHVSCWKQSWRFWVMNTNSPWLVTSNGDDTDWGFATPTFSIHLVFCSWTGTFRAFRRRLSHLGINNHMHLCLYQLLFMVGALSQQLSRKKIVSASEVLEDAIIIKILFEVCSAYIGPPKRCGWHHHRNQYWPQFHNKLIKILYFINQKIKSFSIEWWMASRGSTYH